MIAVVIILCLLLVAAMLLAAHLMDQCERLRRAARELADHTTDDAAILRAMAILNGKEE